MDTMFTFIEFALGFVPFIGIVAVIVTALWAATKLFPKFGVMMDNASDALFGVTAEPEEITGFRIHRSNYTRV